MYNRWLATLGGGEKLGLSIAEYISQSYPVTVVTHQPVSKELAERRLSLDLSRVEFLFIPDRQAPELTPITGDYDLFICASFMDYFPSRAPKSALLVYFPSATDLQPDIRLRRRIKLALRRWLRLPSFTAGVSHLETGDTSLVRRLDSPLKVQLPGAMRTTTCRFDLAALDESVRQVQVLLDNQPLGTFEVSTAPAFNRFTFLLPGKGRQAFQELRLSALGSDGAPIEGRTCLVLKNFVIDHPAYRLYEFLFERWMKSIAFRLEALPPGHYSIMGSVDTYNAIWAISEFSRYWIKRYWDRESEILYPPVTIEDFRVAPKRNQILNVGRFFAGNHNKKHLVMISAFKEMVDQGLRGWELHLAGGTTPGEEHQAYFQQVLAQSQGYPIVIHPDTPFEELVKLYGESAIYWHASGYGEDEEREPIKFEHFGITTVEAMASGCVPVVIGKGGQPEIVKHGQNGFLWHSLDELKSYSLRVMENSVLLRNMSEAALASSRSYDKVNFNARLQKLLDRIL
jgi:glycosyltransferase involved in cell wall biosynthesis